MSYTTLWEIPGGLWIQIERVLIEIKVTCKI